MSSGFAEIMYSDPGPANIYNAQFVVSYDASAANADGSYNITGIFGSTSVGPDGTDGHLITGLIPPGGPIGNNNHIFVGEGQPHFDQHGLAFTVGENDAPDADFRLYSQDGVYYTQQGAIAGINLQPGCYVSGTLIATTRGAVAVEHLAVGDVAVTASGRERPIVWLGHHTIACVGRAKLERVWPVRITAHAFGEDRPSRDLWLSPDHAVVVTCLSEVLIPVKHLVNGATIAQVPVDSVTYWHVELDRHDLLLAENLPAESFLDTGGRDFFSDTTASKAGAPLRALKTAADFCRPIITEGPIVDAVRLQLLARARQLGWGLTDVADLHVLADGRAIRPDAMGQAVHFTLPAGTRDLRLLSRSFVPRHTDVATFDDRRLGVPLRSLHLTDARGRERMVPLDDPSLLSGFHPAQTWDGDRWRWTDGDARLSPGLWNGCEGMVTLTLHLAPERGTLRAWQQPKLTVSDESLAPLAPAA